MARVQELLRDFGERLPAERGQRVKLIASVVVLVLCGLWLAYFVFSSLGGGRPPARPLDTPGWRVVKDVESKLAGDEAFNDVSLAVVSEKPPKFVVRGAVRSEEELERLKRTIAEIRADDTYDWEVMILNPR